MKSFFTAALIFALALTAGAQQVQQTQQRTQPQQTQRQQLDSIRAARIAQRTTNETFPSEEELRISARILDSIRISDSLLAIRAEDTLLMQNIQTRNLLVQTILGLQDSAAMADSLILFNEMTVEFTPRQRLSEEILDSIGLTPFGTDYFRIAQDLMLVPNIGPVNSDYVLGVGDEVIIQIWGDVQSTESFVIGRNGAINPTGIGQQVLAGSTLREARQKLIQRYSRIYSGVRNGGPNATTFVEITTGTLRSKSVIVVGEVELPGNYLIPSTAGIIRAIAQAGGPTNNASLRNVHIRRRGADVVDTVDLYDFFLKGVVTDNVNLADFDVILLNPVERYVHISGAIRRPGRYELKENETFSDLIRYAGGFLPEAYTENILIERTTAGQKRQSYTLNQEDFDRVFAQSNDFAVIEFIDKLNNTVSIEGAVRRPGVWGFTEGMKISDLLELSGGVLEEFFGDRIVLVRTMENFEKEILSANLNDVLAGRNDIALQKWDVLRVFSIWDLQHHKYIDVFGRVKNPGRYFLRDNMTVQDIILLAGGFERDAYTDTVEISRVVARDAHRGVSTKAARISVPKDFFTQSSHELQHQDVVFVREDVSAEEQEIVYLGGEFRFPGHYAKISRDETVSALINRAGGFRQNAYLDGTVFFRSRDSLGQIAIDFNRLFSENARRARRIDDIVLEHGDSIIANTDPRTVTVAGQVNSLTSTKFVEGMPVRYYINRAGGLTLQGQRGTVYVTRANGERREVTSFRDRNIVNSGSEVFAVAGPPPRERNPQIVFAGISALTTVITASVTMYGVLNR